MELKDLLGGRKLESLTDDEQAVIAAALLTSICREIGMPYRIFQRLPALLAGGVEFAEKQADKRRQEQCGTVAV